MQRTKVVALIGLASIASIALAQEVDRYVERNNKPTVVTPDNRFPVTPAPLADRLAALDSFQANGQSSGVRAGAQVFYSVTITLATGEGPGQLMIWDRTTVPADGALSIADRPLRCVYLDAGRRSTVFSSALGLGMANGIAWAFSSSADCQTLSRTPVNFVSISYKAPRA